MIRARRNSHIWERKRAFRSDRDGAVSVEFALLMAPFALLLQGIIEVGMILYADASLQHATDAAARLIRTGQVTNRAGTIIMNIDTFIGRLCSEATILKDCDTNISIDVRAANSFDALSSSMPDPLTVGPDEPGGNPDRDFSPGGSRKATSIIVTYDWSLGLAAIMPLGNVQEGSAMRLQAITVFRSEPY